MTRIRSPTTVRGYRFKVKRISTKLGHVRLEQLIPPRRRGPARRGELTGLRWTDIDFIAGRLHVGRTIKHDLKGALTAGPPKRHQARRIALDTLTQAFGRLCHSIGGTDVTAQPCATSAPAY